MKHEPERDPTMPPEPSLRPTRRQRLAGVSIRTSLVVVLLVPLAATVGLASTVVASQLSSRRQAEATRQSSLVLDNLLRARVDIYAEYIPSQSVVTSRSFKVSPAALDSLLGVNVQAELVAARKAVDHQAAFGTDGPFHRQFTDLLALRRSIDAGTATPAEVATAFNQLDSTIEQRWQQTYNRLADTSGSSDTPTTRRRLQALGSSFEAFTAGVGEENLRSGGSLETVLTQTPTPAQLESLIVSRQQFEDSTRSFPGSLGPEGTVAWNQLTDDPLNRQFSGYVGTAIAVGLGDLPPPVSVSSAGVGEVARSEVAWASSLSALVLATSADLRAATAAQAGSATTTLIVTCLLMLLVFAVVLVAVVVLSRRVQQPLVRIVDAASSVREGELDIPLLDESGPKELATAASAFNEMAATLRAVQAQAIALAGGDLDDPVLLHQLPGRTGAALQSALDQLHLSVESSERERKALFERATRDSLTGLLNRGAALEALEIDLASVRRSQGSQVLTLFFIDLDDLKSINDSAGHDVGDSAIQAVADALRATTRASDVVARFGGDEFVVGLLGTRDSTLPAGLAGRIGAHVAASRIEDDGRRVTLACSIGVAVSEPSDTAIGMLIERADEALYDAKARGKGQTRWFGQTDRESGDVPAGRLPVR